MKKLLLTAATLLFIINAHAQSKGANIIGFSTGYYNAIENPNSWWWWGFNDEVLNFSRGAISKINLQRDIRLSKKTYFSPSATFMFKAINTSTEDINGSWRTFNREREIAGGSAIRFKRYLSIKDNNRYYMSVEAELAFKLLESSNRLVIDQSGERNTTRNGNIIQMNDNFFANENGSLGINFGYEKQVDKEKFWYVQAGFSRIYYSDTFSWDTYIKRLYSVGVGIGFQKFRSR